MNDVPGHSAGSVALLDEAAGELFASDAVGNNRPTIAPQVADHQRRRRAVAPPRTRSAWSLAKTNSRSTSLRPMGLSGAPIP